MEMMTDFQLFIDSVQHVPSEFERSINLLKTLDTKVLKSIDTINGLFKEYKQTNSQCERSKIRKQIADLEEKLDSYGADKLEVAEQTYQLLDNTINQLSQLQSERCDVDSRPIGWIAMPEDPDEPKYCNCRAVSWGEMIACDNKDCPIEWFHYGCVNITVPPAPKAKWYCDDCKRNGHGPQARTRTRKARARTGKARRRRP